MKTLNQNRRVLASGACVALLFSALVQTAGAQETRARAEAAMAKELQPGGRIITRWPEGVFAAAGEPNHAVIGVTTSSGGRDQADTLGVLIESVTVGSPAEKAGIKAGSRITAVNGVSLRVSSLDSDDPELQGIGQRRLVRELSKVKVGDEVELRVVSGTSTQTLKVKTVSPNDLVSARKMADGKAITSRIGGLEKRASLGVSLGSTNSVRDTLGIFVSSVVNDGPAEKAGIVEGDRIAAINGVDVRVPREDAEDHQVAMARVNRFTRELAKLAPGDKATLRVYSGGKYREVQVTTGSGTDMMFRNFPFSTGDGFQKLSLPNLNFDNMPVIIRSRLGGDSDRVVYRKVLPSAGGATLRKVSPTVIRRVSQE